MSRSTFCLPLFTRVQLWHLLLVFVALAAWTSTIIPLGEGPDELPHFTVTRYIVQQRRLPDTPDEHEAFQPPLYYLLNAALTFWIDTRDFTVKANADYDPLAHDAPKTLLLHTRAEAFPYQGWALAWHLMRALSIAMGAATIAAIYATALALTGERTFALLSAALVAFLPGYIFMSAVVNNDDLAALLAALLCWRIVLMMQRPISSRESLLIGVLLGLGLLSKTSMLAFVVTISVALLAAARMQHWTWREWLRANALIFGVALIVSGWYFVRNAWLYGDWLAWPLVLAANAVRTHALSASDWLTALAQVYRGFWLEWIGIELDELFYWMLGVFAILAMIGAAWSVMRGAWRARYRVPNGTRTTHHALNSGNAAFLILAFHLLVIFLSWLRWTQTVLGTEQARLFYPALASLILLLAFGLRALHSYLPFALAGTLLVLAAITPLLYFAPTYAPAPRITALPADAQPISATFKDKLRLIGWSTPTAQVRAGDTLQLALYWQALKDLSDDDWLKIQLLDVDDHARIFKDGSPSAGRDSTDSWRHGELIASWHRMPIPDDMPRGVYRLTVGVHPFGRKNWFPIDEENMPIALGDQLILCEVTVE